MRSCKYCGTYLDYIGEHKDNVYFSCDFCDMTFSLEQTAKDRERKSHIPESYETYRRTTKELLKCNTIELFHLLKDYREKWYNHLEMVKRIKSIYKENGVDVQGDETYLELYKEFEDLTKYKFTIENVLIEKAGYLPEKLTNDFLCELIERAEQTTKNKMNVFIP